MAIFIDITTEDTVQIDDKFRIYALRSFISKDEPAITKVEIKPSSDEDFVDVTGSSSDDWYLDWAYSTEGTKEISVRITTDGDPVANDKTATKDVVCISSADDKLFSTDQQLKAIEYDILKYLPKGKNSWKYVHRIAQSEILEWLYTNGYVKHDNTRITKDEVLRIEEVSYWSRYIALRFIFQGMSNVVGDIFEQKAQLYENWEHKWRTKAILKLDYNGDGEQSEYETRDLTSVKLVRR